MNLAISIPKKFLKIIPTRLKKNLAGKIPPTCKVFETL